MIDIFANRKTVNGKTQVPVWFMRQAGRYHQHYQELKKKHDFITLCKNSELACEVTLGPIEDFKFDAAILFSDLLFPLEKLGMGLKYAPGPKLDYHLHEMADFEKLNTAPATESTYDFQGVACELLKKNLPSDVTLLGFTGAPFTLFTYATEGAHAGSLVNSKKGLFDGRYEKFCELIIPEIITQLSRQAKGGAQALCLFDTAVGECTYNDFKEFIIPKLKYITATLKKDFPDTKIIYYSRNTHLNYLQAIEDENIDVLGVDWRNDLAHCLQTLGKDYYVQGNFDPCWLHLSWEHLQAKLETFKKEAEKSSEFWNKWVMGLGHGVLQHTPEDNVRNTVKWIHENLHY